VGRWIRHRVLLVAGELELRAMFARELVASGYAVELASDMKRALRLAADDHFRVALVAPGPSPTSPTTILTLRDTVPGIIVVVEELDEIARASRNR
jgi:DNA-binding response OmpR family regulator